MRILLTGGTGYIGSHAAVVLMQAGYEVFLYDNLSNSQSGVVERINKIIDKPCILVQGDIRDTCLLRETLDRYDIEAVIHFAGLKAVGESMVIPLDYYANNVQGTISLLQAMQQAHDGRGIKTLVFSSSATVYGTPQYLPIDEAHQTKANNPYGRSKLHIEEMLVDIAHADPSWRIASLRYFNPVGAHESGLIGEEPSGVPNNLLPYLLQVAAGKLPYLNIFGDDYPTVDGTGIRDYVHVMDLVEGHLAVLEHLNTPHQGFCAFNLGTGRGHSVLELVNMFEAKIGADIPYKMQPRRAGDVAVSYANVDKAAKVVAWQAKRPIDDVIDSAWQWQSK